MRKKVHRNLNPNNRFYDQFYLINYLEVIILRHEFVDLLILFYVYFVNTAV